MDADYRRESKSCIEGRAHPQGVTGILQKLVKINVHLRSSGAADPAVLLTKTADPGAGEASAISFAWKHRRHCLLILDEKRVRRVATALGLPKTGVLAILADAANQGLVDFKEVVRRLAAGDFPMSESVISQVRARLQRGFPVVCFLRDASETSAGKVFAVLRSSKLIRPSG